MRAPLLCLLALAPLSACGATADPGAPAPTVAVAPTVRSTSSDAQVWLDFDHVTAEFGSLLPDVVNGGTARVRTEVTTAHGGRVRLAPGMRDGGALRLPEYDGTPAGPAAALLVWDTEGVLSPGERDFDFGASFRIDDVSDGAPSDNGDNLLQRGLFTDTTQIKLQVDHGVPSCRVAGSAGEVMVVWPEAVERGRWFAVRCARSGELVSLSVRDAATGRSLGAVQQQRGVIGSVEFAADVPLAVGAKVVAGGGLPTSATDQFNGVVDDVVLAIAE